MKYRRSKKKRSYIKPEKVLIIKQIILGVILFSFLALLITGIWYGTRISSLTISMVSVDGSETIPEETVREIVNDNLEGEYWHLIPHRFVWFYPEEKILSQLNQIERIKDVKIESVSGTKLNVAYNEYVPYALWCAKKNDTCYFIDRKGFAFGEAPSLLGGSLIRYFKTDKEPQLRTRFIDDNFSNTIKFSELVSEVGWYVNEVEIDSVGDVFYVLGGESELYTTLTTDPYETFSYLETLINAKEFSHLEPGNFNYIDLRFGEKLYVKEGKEEVASSTENILESSD